MSCPRVISASSVGTANSGVPQKTSLTGVTSAAAPSPLSGFLQLANAPLHEVALQGAQVVDEEHTVQMIDLVLHRARQQIVALGLEEFAVHVLRAHLHARRALDLFADLRKAEAAFLFKLLAFALDDL